MPKAVHTDEKGLYHKKGEGIDLTGGTVTLRRKVIALTNGAGAVTRSLLASESGSLITIETSGNAGAISLTLPAPADNAGVWYTVILKKHTAASGNGDFNLSTNHADTNFFGALFADEASNANVDLKATGDNKSRIFIDNSDVHGATTRSGGTRIQVWCDGSTWQYAGLTSIVKSEVGTSGGSGFMFINNPL